MLPPVWPLPLSLATTRGISFDFSSSPYLDVSVQGVPLVYLLIQYTIHDSSSCVFPHSDIRGSMLICSSPQLFAACHVLRRLPMPRHSPYALLRLNYFCICLLRYILGSLFLLELLCFILAVYFGRSVLSLRPAKLFSILPFTEKPDFVADFSIRFRLLVFSLYFCLSCMSH